MAKKFYFYSNLLAWALVLFLIGNCAFSWTTPTGNPPSSNLPAPLNVSSTNQSKGGYLAIGTSTAPTIPLEVIGNGYFSGNVGIGTTNPDANLHIQGSSNDVYNLHIKNGGGLATGILVTGGNSGSDASLLRIADYNNTTPFFTVTDGNSYFQNGNVGIGTTTPLSKLHVANGDVAVDSGQAIQFVASNLGYNKIERDTTNGGLAIFTGGSSKVSILDSGNVGIGTTSPGYKLDVSGTGRFTDNITALGFFYSSDETLKENIQKIETPLAKIMKLDGISFDWKESGEKSIGLIAQDVEKVFPEIVETDEETGLKSIEYAKLVAPLIEAVKEQQKMIDEQREIIDKQGEEIKSLEVSLGQL